jgi:cytidyltransferase-like protein
LIVETPDLFRLRQQVGMVDGGFDPLHRGHIEYFKAAAELGAPLLANITGDEYVATKHLPLLPDTERMHVIDAIRFVTYTHLSTSSTERVLETLQPRFYIKGKDWESRLPDEQHRICAQFGIEIVFLDTLVDSSSRILGDYETRLHQRARVSPAVDPGRETS